MGPKNAPGKMKKQARSLSRSPQAEGEARSRSRTPRTLNRSPTCDEQKATSVGETNKTRVVRAKELGGLQGLERLAEEHPNSLARSMPPPCLKSYLQKKFEKHKHDAKALRSLMRRCDRKRLALCQLDRILLHKALNGTPWPGKNSYVKEGTSVYANSGRRSGYIDEAGRLVLCL